MADEPEDACDVSDKDYTEVTVLLALEYIISVGILKYIFPSRAPSFGVDAELNMLEGL